MTTVICFDCDGTLLRFERPYESMLADVFEQELGRCSPDLLDTYDDAFYDAFEGLEPEPVREGMRAVVAVADCEADPDALAEALLAAEQAATTVPAGTRESLAALGASNTLAVITNGVGTWQRAKLAHHDLLEYFETVVTSYDAGAHKPDPAPFEELRTRTDADQYVMVGDDYEADVEGARAAGFIPVHVEDDADGPAFWATLRAMV